MTEIRDAARRILKSHLRSWIFTERLRETKDSDKWAPMLDLEQLYAASAEEEWAQIVKGVPLATPEEQDAFCQEITSALRVASAEVLNSFPQGSDFVTLKGLIGQYIENFSIDTLFRSGRQSRLN